MRILHCLEISHFKGYRSSGRIPLEHPSVLIGPNNCGKTTALQAIALWSTAVRTNPPLLDESQGFRPRAADLPWA